MLYVPQPTDPWTQYSPWPWQKIVLDDGTVSKASVVMRRKLPGGGFEYRALTDDEAADKFQDRAW